MEAPVLTASTVAYLFASEWAPAAEPGSSWALDVPGGKVDGLRTATDLLGVAIWRLRDKDVVAIEQLRPYAPPAGKRVRAFNEPSFTRLELVDDGVALPGLQGLIIRRLKEEPRETRRVVAGLDMDRRNPFAEVASWCLGEAKAAGVADLDGKRWNPFRKPVIADQAAYDALRPVHEQIRAERNAYRDAHPELDDCVLADCEFALFFAYGTSS